MDIKILPTTRPSPPTFASLAEGAVFLGEGTGNAYMKIAVVSGADERPRNVVRLSDGKYFYFTDGSTVKLPKHCQLRIEE